MKYFSIKYYDEIEAETIEEAIKKLLKCLASDVEHNDVDAFTIKEFAASHPLGHRSRSSYQYD